MKRLVMTALGVGSAAVLAACGSATASSTTSTPASAAQGGRGLGRAAAGQLVQINGATLIVSNQNGDTTVTYTSSTVFTQTSTATVADISVGTCIAATGTKDAGGAVSIDTVRVSSAVNGACSLGGAFGRGNGAPRTPNPNFTPPPQFANRASVRGLVIAARGTSVTVKAPDGSAQAVAIPTTVRVAKSDIVQASTLQTGDCVLAAGPRSASGTVNARSINIVPAGPNGCASGGGFGFGRGGFGGGGFGGGFGSGGGGGGSGSATT